MKKTAKQPKNVWCSMDATTTGKDWGFIPVPCKGGKTTNCDPTMPVVEAFKLCHGKKN